MSDIALLVANALVAIAALIVAIVVPVAGPGFTFIAFLTGACAAFMLIVVVGAYRGARSHKRHAPTL